MGSKWETRHLAAARPYRNAQHQLPSDWALRLGAQPGTETKEQNHRTVALHIHHTQGQAHGFGSKLGGSLNKCRKHIPCICYSNS